MTAALRGKVVGNRGYISKALMQRLWQGDYLLTGIRHVMKNLLLHLLNKRLLRKRSIIETLFAKLKRGMGLEHTRHCSAINALIHILSCLAAYSLDQTKVKVNISTVSIPNLSSPYPKLGLTRPIQISTACFLHS